MTLIEVVGGLGLLATLMVSLLLAKARFTRQAAAADRRLRAVTAADALLIQWRQQPAFLPRSGTGVVPGDGQMAWRTGVISNPPAGDLGAQVVRLEIVDERPDTAGAVLTSVEVLVDAQPKERHLEGSTTTPARQPPKASKRQKSPPAAKPTK